MSITWWYRVVCILFILLTIPVAFSSCAGGNQVGLNAATEAMKQIPSDYEGYWYINVAQIRNDFDLRPLYDQLRASFGDVSGSGISVSDINAIAGGATDSSVVCGIFSGNFDFNKIRKSLQDAGAEKTEYMNVETWTVQAKGQTQLYALTPGTIFMGTYYAGREYIDVITGKAKSLYENKDFRDVVDRSPAMSVYAARAGEGFPSDIADCVAVARSFEKIDTKTIRMTFVGKFTDTTTASNSLSDFKSWALTNTNYNLEQVQSVQKGEFIEVAATFPISELGTQQTPEPTQSPVSGTELIYQADLSQIGNESAAEAMLGAIDIIARRLDAYGISEAVVQKLGSNEIVVQLPGVRDVEAAITLIGSTAQLEFKELVYDSSGNPVLDSSGNYQWIPATAIDSSGKEVPLTGKYLKRNAQVVFAPNTNAPEVSFEFDAEGATLFSEITGRLIGKPLGIFLDNQLISSPTVRAQIGASGVIENISLNEANNLAILLNAGALPCPLKLISRHSLTH